MKHFNCNQLNESPEETNTNLADTTEDGVYRSYDDLPLFLTIPQVCAVLNIGKNTAYDMIHCGQIKSTRFGHQIRIPKTALQIFIN